MAEELVSVTRQGRIATVEVAGCVHFIRSLDDQVASLIEATGGRATTVTRRDGTQIHLTVTVTDISIDRRKLRDQVTAWFEEKRRAFTAKAWDIRNQALQAGPPPTHAMAVHSQLRV